MKAIKFLRLILLVCMIGLACVLPVPLAIKYSDNLPTNLTELVEQNDDEDDADCKALF